MYVPTLTADSPPATLRGVAAAGTPLGSFTGHRKWITSISWEPAHKALPCKRFATASKDNTIKVWNADSRQCLFSMTNHTKAVTCVRYATRSLV